MRISLGYAKEKIEVNIPEKNLQGILAPKAPQASLSEEESVHQALLNPIGSPLLKEIVKPGEKVVIVTSDITRPVPTAKILPFVVEQLNQAGFRIRILPWCSVLVCIVRIYLKNMLYLPARKRTNGWPVLTVRLKRRFISAKPAAARRLTSAQSG